MTSFPMITSSELSALGEQAFELVRSYSQMGYHRTGSPVDDQTIDWLAEWLSSAGAEVTCPPFPYQHYDADVSIISGDNNIEAMALYYAYDGTTTISRPGFGEIDGHDAEDRITAGIGTAIDEAKQNGCDGLILTTQSPNDALCGINRQSCQTLNFPVILIASKDSAQIRQSHAVINISASTRAQTARNVIARFRHLDRNRETLPLLLTTPVSGWFNCAGERGCGIAIALILACRLGAQYPVDLLLASGHELGFAGGHHLAQQYDSKAHAVVHLGSAIANISAGMTSICSAPPNQFSQVSEYLNKLDIQPLRPKNAADHHEWVGESMCWAEKNWPMLSIAGISPHFHTPLDRSDNATTPALLASAIDQIYQAARVLMEA